MNAIDAIRERHCYRGKYLSTPVPREHLVTIMEAGLAAPSGCNTQTTSLIAVDDAEVLKSLREVIPYLLAILRLLSSACLLNGSLPLPTAALRCRTIPPLLKICS